MKKKKSMRKKKKEKREVNVLMIISLSSPPTQADVYLMQNMDHLSQVVEFTNRTPTSMHDTDITRIKRMYLEELAKYFRQTLIFSAFANPELNALFNRKCMNVEGKVSRSVAFSFLWSDLFACKMFWKNLKLNFANFFWELKR